MCSIIKAIVVVSQDEVQSLKEASAQRCIRVCVLVVLFVCVCVCVCVCFSIKSQNVGIDGAVVV